MEEDFFINIKYYSNTLDRYAIRKAILEALKWSLIHMHGKLLDAGCGQMPYKEYILTTSKVTEYIGLDIDTALNYSSSVKPNYTWDGITMPFDNNHFDCCIATEVLEHCPEPEVFLKEVHRVIKPNGIFFFTVPFLWNLHEVPHDEYRYTPFSLERHLKNSGFKGIEIKATGGWHAAMAQMLGLWVRRSPMSKSKRKILSRALKPLIKFLLNKDILYTPSFVEGQMITGLYGIAKK